jgi:hypothetical protein
MEEQPELFWTVEFLVAVSEALAGDPVAAADIARALVADGGGECWVTPADDYPVRVENGTSRPMSEDEMDPDVVAEWALLDDADEETEE